MSSEKKKETKKKETKDSKRLSKLYDKHIRKLSMLTGLNGGNFKPDHSKGKKIP